MESNHAPVRRNFVSLPHGLDNLLRRLGKFGRIADVKPLERFFDLPRIVFLREQNLEEVKDSNPLAKGTMPGCAEPFLELFHHYRPSRFESELEFLNRVNANVP